jgi:hypothetical protein
MALRNHNLLSGRLKNDLCEDKEAMFQRCWEAMRTPFLHPENPKKAVLMKSSKRLWWSRCNDVSSCPRAMRLWWSRLSDVWSKRMALRTHNLPPERLKMQLWWCRWSGISWWLKAIWKHFLHPGLSKKRFVRSCRSDDVSSWMVVRTHNLPSGHLKKRIWWTRWSDMSKSPKAIQTYFLHSEQKKST